MEERKKRVGFVTAPIWYRTGFSNNIKTILPILYKKDKYELFHLSQSVSDVDINLLRFPWQSSGALRMGEFNLELFNKDQGYNRLCAYGNEAVQRFITENKLDCCIHIEDIWSSSEQYYLDSRWWKYFKNNFLQWTTADSWPLLDTHKRWAKECPNFWVWASFAERALKKENPEMYDHVKTVFGVLDQEEYRPLSPFDKIELRRKFKIPENTKIFIQLGRNQLRKLYPCSLEALSKFKQRNPEHKVKLLFHCSWNEPAGWPFA